MTYAEQLFACDELLVAEDIIECNVEDCGAPCGKSDVSEDGYCRYCGDRITLPGTVQP